MSVESHFITEADILIAVVAPDEATLPAHVARSFLDLKFSTEQVQRMQELAEANNAGTLTDVERSEMESYARVRNFLSLIQSKARLSLKTAS